MLTDDMKVLHATSSLTVPAVQRYTVENANDIPAFGFNLRKTFMFSKLDYVGGSSYQEIIRVARLTKVSDIKQALGSSDEQNVGMFYCCSTRCAGTLVTSFPGILGPGATTEDLQNLQNMDRLLPCSWDIDGCFSQARKHAETLSHERAAFLYSSRLPIWKESDAKMSAYMLVSAAYLVAHQNAVRQKVEPAFASDGSGHALTLSEYLRFFLEDDEELLRSEKRFWGRRCGCRRIQKICHHHSAACRCQSPRKEEPHHR